MSKNFPIKTTDVSRFCNSSFTLTFAVEVLGIEVWHDCNEGWLDLGPCSQGMKIQYNLYPGQSFEVDILIWPHAAKIWCGAQYGWVRTWQFLNRRFLTFSITHMFPVRVMDLRNFTATITPTSGLGSLGANAKNDKNSEVFLPALKFGDTRFFASIVASEESLEDFIRKLIWEPVARHIPANFMDAVFDTPQVVTDVRHQDAIMYELKEAILNTNRLIEEEAPEPEEPKYNKHIRRESKAVKKEEKKKATEVIKVKFEIKLSGESILAGIGRIVPFDKIGDRPADLGEIIALISSNNLPAQDDLPVFFVNVDNLTEAPVEVFKKLRISQIYTRWVIGDEVHSSEPQNIKSANNVNFNDRRALPMDPMTVSDITAIFQDNPFEIQLRGIRPSPVQKDRPKFFGYQKGDPDFGATSFRKQKDEDANILIAITKIDSRCFSKGVNKFIRGEYPLLPPTVQMAQLEREGVCTNDLNLVKMPVTPNIVVPPHVVLQAQMTLEVSMGFVGCKPRKITNSFSRLYSLVGHTDIIVAILNLLTEINEEVILSENKDNLLTGFTLDAGNVILLYVEGPTDGHILKIWDMTGDFYPRVKPIFSTSARYPSRLYPELLQASVPFYMLKMYVPLGVLLACPPVYARPALPLPTRSAILKLGRLISGKVRLPPARSDMPTGAELKSFRLELCVAPKPVVCHTQSDDTPEKTTPTKTSLQMLRINWDK